MKDVNRFEYFDDRFEFPSGEGDGDGDCSGDGSDYGDGIERGNSDSRGGGFASSDTDSTSWRGNGHATFGSACGDGQSDAAMRRDLLLFLVVTEELVSFFWMKNLKYAVAYYKAETQEEKDSIIGILELNDAGRVRR